MLNLSPELKGFGDVLAAVETLDFEDFLDST